MNTYPKISAKSEVKEAVLALRQIAQERDQDIRDFNNLNKVLVTGRSTTRVPSSSADVIAGDQIGDFCPSATYLYILVANGGSPVWRRITMGAW